MDSQNGFGQISPITTTLRNVLRDYSGAQLLNEQLQNADDAGSRIFKVLLDDRAHRADVEAGASLLGPGMAALQGPALYCFDDAEFKQEDFESIQRVGDGLKRGDPTRTGQFGLGFNSVYHITDVPMFCTGKFYVVFDPHRTHLPGGATGAFYNMRELPSSTYTDQFAPFRGVFGCNADGTWSTESGTGTLFRLPLRTSAQAKTSKIKRGRGAAPSVAEVDREIVQPFLDLAHRRLLFLRSVESIEVWRTIDGEPRRLFAANVAPDGGMVDQKTRAARGAVARTVKVAMKKTKVGRDSEADEEAEPPAARRFFSALRSELHPVARKVPRPIYTLPITVTVTNVGGKPGRRTFVGKCFSELWVVSVGFGDDDDVAFVTSPRARSTNTFLPYAAVAALVGERGEDLGSPWRPPHSVVEGRLYAALPTPICTRLPVHIDGRWELTRSRNNLVTDTSGGARIEGRTGVDAVSAQWNMRLAGRVAAAAYARLLRELARGFLGDRLLVNKIVGGVVHGLLPPAGLEVARLGESGRSTGGADEVLPAVAAGVYHLLLHAGADAWRTCGYSSGSETKTPAKRSVRVLQTTQGSWVGPRATFFTTRSRRSEVDAPPENVLKALGEAGCPLTDAPYAGFAAFCGTEYSDEDTKRHALETKPGDRFPRDGMLCGMLQPASACAWMRSKDGAAAVQKWLSGLDSSSRTASRGNRSYIRNTRVEVCRMLLTYALSESDPALLTGVPVVLMADGAVASISVCETPSEKDARELFLDIAVQAIDGDSFVDGFGASLIDDEQLRGELFVENGGEGSCAQQLWPHRAKLTVRAFTPRCALPYTLPPGWCGKQSVQWDPSKDQPSREWLARFWKAVDQFEALGQNSLDDIDEWPLIPCTDELVSLRGCATVIRRSTSRVIGDDAIAALQALGVRIAEEGFAPHCLGERIAELSGLSVARALQHVMQARGGNVLDWSGIGLSYRTAVLETIASDAGDLGESALNWLAQLPIFETELGSCIALPPPGARFYRPTFDDAPSLGRMRGSVADSTVSPAPPRHKKAGARPRKSGSSSEIDEANRVFLKCPLASCVAVYEALGVKAMPRADYLCSMLSPQSSWRRLEESERIRRLHEVRKHYEVCREQQIVPYGNQSSVAFRDHFASLPLFWNSSREWFSLLEMADPRSELHIAFSQERLPPLSLRGTEGNERSDGNNVDGGFMPFFERAGMSSKVTREFLLQCARQVDSEWISPASEMLRRRARLVVSSLFSLFASFSSEAGNDLTTWLAALGELRIAEPAYRLPGAIARLFVDSPKMFARFGESAIAQVEAAANALPKRGGSVSSSRPAEGSTSSKHVDGVALVRFKGNVIASGSSFREHGACWTMVCVLSSHGCYPPRACVEGLGATAAASLEDIGEHLVNLSAIPQGSLRAWEVERQYSRPQSRSRQPQPRPKRSRSTVAALPARLAGGSLLDHLRSTYEMLAALALDAGAKAAVQRIIADRAVVLLLRTYDSPYKGPEFVRPSQLFRFIETAAPPYAYSAARHVHDVVYTSNVLVSLGTRLLPTFAQVSAWIEHLQQVAKHGPLTPKYLKTAVALAEMLINEIEELPDFVEGENELLLPNASGVLTPASGLVVWDADWLSGRVDKARLPLTHPSLPAHIARKLGARGLTLAVREEPEAMDPANVLQEEELPQQIAAAIELWIVNLHSSGFRSAVRRAVKFKQEKRSRELQRSKRSYYHRTALAPSEEPRGGRSKPQLVRGGSGVSMDEVALRLASLSRARIVPVRRLRSRFLVDCGRGEGNELDVTLDATGSKVLLTEVSAQQARRRSSGGTRKSSLLEGRLSNLSVPTIYLLFETEGEDPDSGALVARRGWRRRWLPNIAILLDKYLEQEFEIGDGLLRDLLSSDDVEDMLEVLATYNIPSAELDLSLGAPFVPKAKAGSPRDVDSAVLRVGQKVLVPSWAAERVGEDLTVISPGDTESALIFGRVEALRVQASGGGEEAVLVAITPDEDTVLFQPSQLLRLPTSEEREEELSLELRSRAAASIHEEVQEPVKTPPGSFSIATDGGMTVPTELQEETLKSARDDGGAHHDERPTGIAMEVERVEYRASDGWEESEVHARQALAAREAERLSMPQEQEPPGIDGFLLVKPTSTDMINGVQVPMVKAQDRDSEIVNVVKRQMVTGGYDLVRVGNFSESTDLTTVPDIAFFHERSSLPEIYNEDTYGRQTLARQCCGALRDVCDGVFGYDAAKICLFYSPGARSRFVRQKLMYNIAPIEVRKREKNLGDVRSDAFVYAYFFGLCVHKLAHFFDVVHGTRHDFFMSEYRTQYILKWCELLCLRGFDPADVERQFSPQLWEVQF